MYKDGSTGMPKFEKYVRFLNKKKQIINSRHQEVITYAS